MLTNILDISFQLFEANGAISLGLLEQFIGILIGAVGITGIGIILYCLILKAVTLPLDIWQKATMRKQSLKMNEMRESLEKLKKQYANSPDLYQQKIQEVYKQNNFNMLASCLPMIVTLVILIFAFQSLTSYSQYKNLSLYTGMVNEYNAAILQHCDQDAEGVEYLDSNNVTYTKYESEDESYYIYYLEDVNGNKEYCINTARLMNAANISESECLNYVQDLGRKDAAIYYKDNVEGFFWIKNIYYPDVAWANPLQDYDGFCNSITKKITKADNTEVTIREFIEENTYNEITYNLEEEKGQPNGFFVLVVLTILTNVGLQLITMKSQKEQRELQTADPSSEKMQKWMMFVMPVLFCIFAFIYSSAFSLYLITSALFSLLNTLVINRVVNASFQKMQEKKEIEKIQYGGRKGLTRNWEENKIWEDKNDKKNKK